MSKEIGRREFIKSASAAGAGLAVAGIAKRATASPASPGQKIPKRQGKSVAGLATKPLETVRLGFIGVGARGSGHVEQMLEIEGVEIKAICDNYAPAAEASAKVCVDKGRPAPTLYTNGDEDYKRMVDRDDIDAVIIATPWELHVPMAVATMNAGKHAFTEVPAAPTLEGCWQLVDTAEKTQLHCMMMENVCYGREELLALNMCRMGVLGELLHGEAAYIHDLRGQMEELPRGTGSWRTWHYTKRNGNLYPTHGLGPVCQYMNINRGDRMDFLTSVSSPARVREIYAKEHFPPDHQWRKAKFIAGDINTTMVKTVSGKTIMIQWDEQLPRPYSRLNLIQGTKGVWAGFPNRFVLEGGTKTTESWTQGADLDEWFTKYEHPLWTKMGELAKQMGGHGGMDFVMLWRIVYCLRNGLPLDQDVYDAASWSAISPLSEWSVAHRSQSIDVPDFTRGAWKDMRPLGIVS